MPSHKYKFFHLAIVAVILMIIAAGCSSQDSHKDTNSTSALPQITNEPEAAIVPSAANDSSNEGKLVQPTASPTPEPTGDNAAEEPTATSQPAEPTATSKPLTKPNPTTKPSTKPAGSSKPAPKPTATPVPVKPTATPTTVKPSTAPSTAPTTSPLPIATPSPTVKPTASPKPGQEDPIADVTAETISAKIIADITLGPLMVVEGDQIKENYGINVEKQLVEGIFHQPKMMIQAGEFSIVKLKSDEDYDAVASGFETRAKAIQDLFKDYLEDQYEQAQNYQIIRNGRFVLFSITPDQKKTAEIFNSFFKK
ncbi:hypothetical protein FHS15_005556 [Paenibacillus castaneae]|uniref:DUF4358 domain-containing protein n=1 Tax=Paenibacillus castaneae TaxID=474957 RepID=UPI000C9C8F87|nr:DUF4358 domain-containing protein [Paenibacillus castaneae]NIK80372.1 hypothetical protein [Paenibacillus castaneae]